MTKKMFALFSLILVAMLALAACTTSTIDETPAEMETTDDMEMEDSDETMDDDSDMEDEEVMSLHDDSDDSMEDDSMSETVPMEEVDVEALIVERVNGKHDVDRILNADKTREEWEETLDRMIGYGAKITPEEKEIIIDWLLNR